MLLARLLGSYEVGIKSYLFEMFIGGPDDIACLHFEMIFCVTEFKYFFLCFHSIESILVDSTCFEIILRFKRDHDLQVKVSHNSQNYAQMAKFRFC